MPTLHGTKFAHITDKECHDTRRAPWKAARAGKEPNASAALEISMTILAKGHLVDPFQCVDYKRILLSS